MELSEARGEPAREVVLGEFVLRLDGTVVEVLHCTGLNYRYHVSHVAIEAKERRDGGLDLRIGREVGGVIVGGARVTVPPTHRDAVETLFAESRRRRDR